MDSHANPLFAKGEPFPFLTQDSVFMEKIAALEIFFHPRDENMAITEENLLSAIGRVQNIHKQVGQIRQKKSQNSHFCRIFFINPN